MQGLADAGEAPDVFDHFGIVAKPPVAIVPADPKDGILVLVDAPAFPQHRGFGRTVGPVARSVRIDRVRRRRPDVSHDAGELAQAVASDFEPLPELEREVGQRDAPTLDFEYWVGRVQKLDLPLGTFERQDAVCLSLARPAE